MNQNAPRVPGVPGLCRVLCRVFHWCAGCAGSHTCAHASRKTKNHRTQKHALLRICTRHTRHTRHMLDSYTHFHTLPGTCHGTPGTHTPRAHLPLIFSFKKNVMEENQTPPAFKKVIRCTPENARAMQQAVKAWPELHALVQDLQAQDLFPGLRALSITVTGSEALVDKGLDAVAEINATRAV